MFYANSKRSLKLRGDLFPGVDGELGVRQSCFSSGLLFVICFDSLRVRLEDTIGQVRFVCAFVDDTGAVTHDISAAMPLLASAF